MLLQVNHISKAFDSKPVLQDVSFHVERGEILCLLGPSGCGKSTLLNIIAGLEPADEGDVLIDGQDISAVPVYQRGFGLMLQGLALFPHKNVRDNVGFGLRMAGLPAGVIAQRIGEVLTLVGLAGFERRDVNQLSGGEQQRVALARSLAPRPRLLMLDEPLSSLDRTLRERLMGELRDILTRVNQTAIYVTHDQQEAFALSDRLVILNAGAVAQVGTPQQVYSHPSSTFVARFLGFNNLIPGRMTGGKSPLIETALGTLSLSGDACGDGNVTVLIRPEAAALNCATNNFTATVVEQSFRGHRTHLTVKSNDVLLEFEVDSSISLPLAGSTIHLGLLPPAISCLPAENHP
jgi:ABC-type Fe3+/spermidine/putrescine transport system ATPase subunit